MGLIGCTIGCMTTALKIGKITYPNQSSKAASPPEIYSQTASTCPNLAQNGGFENGRPPTPWVEFSSGGYYLVFQSTEMPVYGGSWAAWLGEYDNAVDALCQDIYLPDNSINTLSFFYHIHTSDTNPDPVDKLDIIVRQNEEDHIIKTYSQLDIPHDEYINYTVPLSLRGDVTLCFQATTNSSGLTGFYLDDVSIQSCPAEEKILFDSGGEIYMINPDGSNLEQLTDNNDDDQLAVFSPDGKYISYFKSENSSEPVDLWRLNLATCQEESWIDTNLDRRFYHNHSYSPDGNQIVFDATTMNAENSLQYSLLISTLSGQTTLLTDQHQPLTPHWGKDNKIYFGCMEGDNNDICWINPDGTAWQIVGGTGNIDYRPNTYTDTIVFQNSNSGYDIFTMLKDGSNVVNLTNNKSWWNSFPYFSPSGESIVYTSKQTGVYEIYRMEQNGADVVQLTDFGESELFTTSTDWGYILPFPDLTPTPTTDPSLTPTATVTPIPDACREDVNRDDGINLQDVLWVVQHAAWGGDCGGCAEDVNEDGRIGLPDVNRVINSAHWNSDCPE